MPNHFNMVAEHGLVGERLVTIKVQQTRARAKANTAATGAHPAAHGELVDVFVPPMSRNSSFVFPCLRSRSGSLRSFVLFRSYAFLSALWSKRFPQWSANTNFTAADQEQSTFESQPSVYHAGMSCTAAFPTTQRSGTTPPSAKPMSRGRPQRRHLEMSRLCLRAFHRNTRPRRRVPTQSQQSSQMCPCSKQPVVLTGSWMCQS